ncbi:WSC domain-containing protein 2-like [Notothenia coriiceps]|uniref:WSC domain-containing protein 2-like n=1 Tax=Notothenia coriiceps TaxID=8208 RepID=A0A6I9N6E6_9TELE|nr:PREDICTED: WSC domain-containing protein 2-like [Notothenia coriiceps]
MYAGLEFGAECYCGHKIQAPNVSDSECNMECKGEKSNLCGGANRLSIYRLELSQESARRYGSSIFKGCFHRPDNVTLALPISAVIQNMSVDKCVDMCTEREKTLAVLGGDRCHCGFPTPLFSLHEPEDESLCLHHCLGEEFETCGNEEYFVVYQTQVQGNIWCLKGLYKGPIGQRDMSGCIIN